MPKDDMTGRYLRLTWVNILSNVTVPLVGLVDTAMLGHLADIRFLAGVALSTILFDYIYWTFGFLRMGTTGTTAQAIGRGEPAEVYLVLYRSLALAGLIAGTILVLQWPLREIGFTLLSGEPGVEQAGRAYFNARVWGAPATLCNFALIGWFLGREQSRHVLAMTVVANLANIVFNYIFIMRMGLAAFGAGLATMIAQYAMLTTGVSLFLVQSGRIPWRVREILHREKLVALLLLNRDILVRTFCLITSFAVFANFSSILGTAVLAANSILLRLLLVASFLIDGAAFASESLAGVFVGARDKASLRRLFRLSLLAGEAFALLFLAVVFARPRMMLGLLTNHEEVVDLAMAWIPWLIPVLLFGALAYMYDGLFLGMTEGRRLRNSMLFSTLGVFLPVAAIGLAIDSPHLLRAGLLAFMAARAATLGWMSRSLVGDGTFPG
jgi:MATE family multidrug resistance protein